MGLGTMEHTRFASVLDAGTCQGGERQTFRFLSRGIERKGCFFGPADMVLLNQNIQVQSLDTTNAELCPPTIWGPL